ncbi:MAG: purine-nucleoside phosphorylase [Turneriella sp.]|nr:purine-nucleoside phosphorylase [Leptospiraceae bacterium]MCX7631794.1 purine-nucleoside phosphorylase [Turneriella sp.]
MGNFITPTQVEEAAAVLRKHVEMPIQAGIVLGSGLSAFAERAEKKTVVAYREIPHFPQSTVPGHSGQFVAGFLADTAVLCMQGRVHYYEGYSMAQVALGVRLMAAIGVRTLILTNAAGGINPQFRPGDFMLISDHINLMGTNPLIGPHYPEWGERFVDQSESYTPLLRRMAKEEAAALGIPCHEGVYAALSGPAYETPAEIRMLRILGADACGMSTVPEAIVARQCGMRILGISLISNMAAGMGSPLHHNEVIEVAGQRKSDFERLLLAVLRRIDEE